MNLCQKLVLYGSLLLGSLSSPGCKGQDSVDASAPTYFSGTVKGTNYTKNALDPNQFTFSLYTDDGELKSFTFNSGEPLSSSSTDELVQRLDALIEKEDTLQIRLNPEINFDKGDKDSTFKFYYIDLYKVNGKVVPTLN